MAEQTKASLAKDGGDNNDNGEKKVLLKETFQEFLRSLLIGIVPVALDYLFSALIIYLFALKNMGHSFFDTFFIEKDAVKSSISAAGTAVGYFMGFVASYLFSVFFVYKHNKKGKTLKGILIYISVEVFAYGFNVLLALALSKILSYTFAFIVRICISYLVVFTLRKFLIFMPEQASKQKQRKINTKINPAILYIFPPLFP